jgi:MinD superfamily P-loop ATPase
MIISVASGKGGTGKTTIAVNLALSIGDVRLLDCDVEAPNAHLFIHPVFEKKQIITAPVPQIDESKCNQCGKCGEICQFKAIVPLGKTILTFPELCHSCGGCMAVCPEKAVTEIHRELGIIEIGRRDQIEFVHGKLRIGEAMSPPLIRAVRAYATPDKLTIIDAPPGTSCPMIAAVKDTDFVLMVTEPTPFGLHDLRLAVETVRTLAIPCGIVINRAEPGNNLIRDYARAESVPILAEIPFDRRIAEAYSRGVPLTESLPEHKETFRHLYRQICWAQEVGA